MKLPRKPTSVDISRWRELYSEGKRYSEIAEIEGWQARTVKKYIESDIRSPEIDRIRTELFKERLGQHWDMLLEGVLSRVDSLSPITNALEEPITASRPGHANLMGISSIKSWSTTEGSSILDLGFATIARNAKGTIEVSVAARGAVEWPLLAQHIPSDPIWSRVND